MSVEKGNLPHLPQKSDSFLSPFQGYQCYECL